MSKAMTLYKVLKTIADELDWESVVRCRDCKHRKEYNGLYHRCSVFERTVKNDDYCSFGERKDGEAE